MKPLHFVGSCQRDLKSFSEGLRQEFGFALYMAQSGSKAINAMPLVGFGGAGVVEIVANDNNSTYRAVYTVRFEKAVYALHAFNKKSKHGISTPKKDMELIRARLKEAERHYQETYVSKNERQRKKSST